MSNVSGYGDNRTFRNSIPPREPYYYITATLDLAGKLANNKVYYLNKLNNFEYLNTAKTAYPNPDDFPGYYYLENQVLIGEVGLSASADLTASNGAAVVSTLDIVTVERAGGVAILTLANPVASYGFQVGDLINVSGITNNGNAFNTAVNVYVPITAINNTNLEYANAGANFGPQAAAGTGVISTLLSFQVGGVFAPSTGSTLIDTWSGPSGNVPGPINKDELQNGQVCYYGTEPNLTDNVLLGSSRYIGLRLSGLLASQPILAGKIYVTLKVYPKF